MARKPRARSVTSPRAGDASPRTTAQRVSSGVTALDRILGGGFFARRMYLVEGAPGTGKTVLSGEIAFRRAALGDRVVFATLLVESHATLLSSYETFGFFDENVIADAVTFVSAYEYLENEGLDGLLAVLQRTVARRRAQWLFVDGIGIVEELAPSLPASKRFARRLATSMSALGCTLVCSVGVEREITSMQPMADGVIRLRHVQSQMRSTRSLEVIKHRGSSVRSGQHVFEISPRGMEIHPRLETAAPRVEEPPVRAELTRERVGVRAIDAMLHGGLPTGSTTAVMGAPGTGKTTLGLHFLGEAASRGARPLYFGFYEPSVRLLERAARLGLPLSARNLDVLWQPALELPLDGLADRLLSALDRTGARHVVIDGIDGFRVAALYPDRLPRFFTALGHELRLRGVTALFTQETNRAGADLQDEVLGVSAVFENLVLLRQTEHADDLCRTVAVLKVRDSDFDGHVRQFELTSRGLVVLGEPSARRPSRARRKR